MPEDLEAELQQKRIALAAGEKKRDGLSKLMETYTVCVSAVWLLVDWVGDSQAHRCLPEIALISCLSSCFPVSLPQQHPELGSADAVSQLQRELDDISGRMGTLQADIGVWSSFF